MILCLPQPIKSPYTFRTKYIEEICGCKMCTTTNRLRNEGKI